MFDKDDDEENDSNAVSAVRYPCMPSLFSLQQTRTRLHLARTGKKLMKWTALATSKELRTMSAKLVAEYESFREKMRNCYILLARGRYFCPSLNEIVVNNLEEHAHVSIARNWKSFSGIKVLLMTAFDNNVDAYPYLGIGQGGIAINEAKNRWREQLKLLVFLAQARVQFLQLEIANKNATKRLNIISKVILPRLNVTNKYILSELEEKEREETFRLKRFKQLKMKKANKDGKDNKCKEEDIVEIDIEINDSNLTIDIKLTKSCDICSNQADTDLIETCQVCSETQSYSDEEEVCCPEICDTTKLNAKRSVVFSEDEKQDENAKIMKDILSHIDDLINMTKKIDKKGIVSFLTEGCALKEESKSSCDLCQEIMKANDSKDVSATASLEIRPENEPCCTDSTPDKNLKISFKIKSPERSRTKVSPCETCGKIKPPEVKVPPCETCGKVKPPEVKVPPCETCGKIKPREVKFPPCDTCGEIKPPEVKFPPCDTCKVNENNAVSTETKTHKCISDAKNPCKVCNKTPENKTSKTSITSCKNKNENKKLTVSIKNGDKSEEPKADFDSDELGCFEKQFKEIIKVTRSQNDDGSISEEKKIITIRIEKRTPLDKKCSGKSTNPCAKSESNISCCSTTSINPKTEPKAKTSNADLKCCSLTSVHVPAKTKACKICAKLAASGNDVRPSSRSSIVIKIPAIEPSKKCKGKMNDAKSKEKLKPKCKAVPEKVTCKDASTNKMAAKPSKQKQTSSNACMSCSSSTSNISNQEKDKMVLQQGCGCKSVHAIPKSKPDWFETLLKEVKKPVKITVTDSLKNTKSVILIPAPCKKPCGSSNSDSAVNKEFDAGKSGCTAASKKILKKQTNSSPDCCSTKRGGSATSVTFNNASTNTKRSTRFDVRSVMSSPLKIRNNIVPNNCICKSDTDLLIKKKRPLWMSK